MRTREATSDRDAGVRVLPRAVLLFATTSVACASTVTPAVGFEDATSRDALLDASVADATGIEDRPLDVARADATDESTSETPPDRCDIDRSFAPVDAPRRIAPLSTFEVSTAQPTLRWSLPADVSTARIEICRDPSCTQLEWTADVRGSSVRVAPSLSRGPHFWRVASHCIGGSSAPSNVPWEFVSPSRVADGDIATGPSGDVDQDGSSDAVFAMVGLPSVCAFTAETLAATDLASLHGPGDTTLDVEGPGVFGDFDRDGWPDLAMSPRGPAAARSFLAFRASGVGRYEPAVTVPFTLPPIHVDERLAPSAAADFDGDGFADVVLAPRNSTTSASRFVVFPGSAEGLRTSPIADVQMGGSKHSPVWNLAGAGDVDLDGHADVVLVGGEDANVAVRLFRGADHGLEAPQTVRLEGNVSFANVSATADFDADGHLDVAMVFEPRAMPSRIVILRGGAMGFPATEDVTIYPRPDRWFIGGAVVGDVDGDGYVDLIAIDSDPRVGDAATLVYRGSRDGVSMTSSSHSESWPPDCRWSNSPPVRDLDGDGRVDRLVLCGDANPATRTRLYVSRGRSDASFAPFVLAMSWDAAVTGAI